MPDLATKYSRTAEFDLGIDLHEDNPLSNFVSKLLDMGHKLQIQLRFANEDINRMYLCRATLGAVFGPPSTAPNPRDWPL